MGFAKGLLGSCSLVELRLCGVERKNYWKCLLHGGPLGHMEREELSNFYDRGNVLFWWWSPLSWRFPLEWHAPRSSKAIRFVTISGIGRLVQLLLGTQRLVLLIDGGPPPVWGSA